MAVNLAQRFVPSESRDASALRTVFQTITAESCPKLFNFHIHTVFSDGRLHPEQVMQQAVQIGLQGLAITDHHSVNGYHRAQQWLAKWQLESKQTVPLPQLWTGTEINADLLRTEVHILAFAFDPTHDALQPYLQGQSPRGEDYQAHRVIASIHAAGGLAILAHPARYKRSPAELIPEAVRFGIDGLESFYAYNNPCPWIPSPAQTQEVQRLGNRYQLLNTCGTDTHGLSLLQRL